MPSMSRGKEGAVHAETWTVPDDHPALAGHFPGRPIVPGVVLLDRVLHLARQVRPQATGWAIAQAKFLRPVGPGAVLRLALASTPRGALGFDIRMGDEAVASGVLQSDGA